MPAAVQVGAAPAAANKALSRFRRMSFMFGRFKSQGRAQRGPWGARAHFLRNLKVDQQQRLDRAARWPALQDNGKTPFQPSTRPVTLVTFSPRPRASRSFCNWPLALGASVRTNCCPVPETFNSGVLVADLHLAEAVISR